ncbi:uncharacterized protein OCT59_003510 [Rhizophagus irregularis]|uniref:Myb-like domain-containing protein n=2 Tax=Rhizophagus irregularis TaxID=588596 RepID=A0A015K0M2_RHIIW|nr:hypothetical protein GLOIN_2v1845098 [Rhizophagus irregularis DAOM 181602=DAOM 197198]EXX60934.1 hypothetical protein RirG_175480 [Rhizophagus irregularis DAOM 197198w]POG64824.1 hypothetical protein GLOIN_2v1845098 [Rhizophagus irregularis DAOM 181602=DAOM 197198]UZO11958.1 hypothetical protein OCT59_003510 [Rhizophagus irregularis]GBC37485.2 hypothetical protein GLOIN_2v1845098 [Rhizophagus irregularis DAOM 181602=DAOM 197198]|eukprot:XP_025171690.1 hypothetical protein GLOIN_2v1845098 [Rhizophagus irregularis DAOM 181602=DAOM 197198]
MHKSKLNRIDPASEKIILKYMLENGSSSSNPFAELSKLIPYSAKKIRQRWINNLDPHLIVHDPLNESEKSFIIKWVENNQLSSNGKIRWKVLIKEIKYVFGKLRSENQVKNYWYSKKRKSTNNINKSTKEKVFRSLKFKKRKQKEPLFSDYIDKNITVFMNKWGHLSNCYMKIHKKFPEYTSKQIRQRWVSKLDQSLCHEPLDKAEEIFVVQWIKDNQTAYDKIYWKKLIAALKEQFGKLRSENKLKNYWYSRKGQVLSKNCVSSEDRNMLLSQDDDDIPPNASRMEILCHEALKYNF